MNHLAEQTDKREFVSSLIHDRNYKDLKHELISDILNDKALREKMVKTLISHLVICNKCGEIIVKEKTKVSDHDNKHYCFACYYGKA
jgi:formylmethanofuran dehydrogenase subunit E